VPNAMARIRVEPLAAAVALMSVEPMEEVQGTKDGLRVTPCLCLVLLQGRAVHQCPEWVLTKQGPASSYLILTGTPNTSDRLVGHMLPWGLLGLTAVHYSLSDM
jgi:hypothetical protein